MHRHPVCSRRGPGGLLTLGLLVVLAAQAHAAGTPPLKDNAREYLALRQTLSATVLTPAQMSGSKSPWRGRAVEVYGRILGRSNASSPGPNSPITLMLALPGLADLVLVDSLEDSPVLAVEGTVHILADLPSDAKPTDHFLLRAVINESDLPAEEQRYAAAEAAAQHDASVNHANGTPAPPAPSPAKNAKPETPVEEVPMVPTQAPAPPEKPLSRPGTEMPRLPASAGKAVGTWKQWVARCNPRLNDTQLEVIARSVLYYSALYGMDHRLSFAMIKCESDFDPTCRSSAGAMGLTQLMPCNATDMGVNPWDLEQNIRAGLRYLSDQLRKFPQKSNYEQCILALACYNAGPGAVKRAGGVPNIPETVRYVKKVSDLFYQLWKSGMP